MTSDDHDHTQCLEMFEKLSEYIDGELDRLTCAEIEKHVDNCVACFSCVETLKRTVALCKEVNEKPVPETVTRRLREIVENLSKQASS